MKRTALLAALTMFGTVAVANPASADERVCTGAIGAETVDDLVVPDGATCRLDGTRVEGNIFVEGDATLDARDVAVDGNVQAGNHRQVTVAASRVGGNVQIEQGGGADVSATTIDGDLQYDDNRAALSAGDNTIGGNLQAMANTGGLEIARNDIDGNLQCKENQPAPTGGDNVVRGSAEDQCAGLAGGGGPVDPGPGPVDPGPQPGGSFCDTAGHTHEANIEKVAAAGIALGNNGCYAPDAPVTRGQLATFLRRAYDLVAGTQGFCDTAGHTHEASIKAVAQAGIAQGSGGCYRPDEPVTRGQMATLLTTAEQLTPGVGPGFCDTADHTHEPSIKAVAQAGLAQGSGGCYRPDEPVTRGQMATFLARALGL